MSEPGCVQLTSPVPDESDCSASNPSAILPVAATAVPPSPGAVTVVTTPGVDTVTGCAPLAFTSAEVEVLPDGVVAAGAARTALNVAAPVDAAVPEPAAVCEGSATIEIRAVDERGADGGHDLVIDDTAAAWPASTVAPLAPGLVPHATANTATSASSTAPGKAKRRIRTHRPRLSGYPSRARGLGRPALAPPGGGLSSLRGPPSS